MKKDPTQIAKEITALVNELVELTGNPAISTPPSLKQKETKGAIGGLNLLIEEGFFNNPQLLTAVIAKLQEMGRHYPKPTIAMGLLNLTRSRVLVRLKDNKTKNWEYAIRK